jgi:subtilisin family serine protease
VVTILDTGVDSVHVYDYDGDGPAGLTFDCYYDLLVASTCFQGPNDFNVHGSRVAGIISARDNVSGILGIAYDPARFVSIRVCRDNGECPGLAIADALDWTAWSAANGYSHQVVNMSIQKCEGSEALSEMIARSAAAGNLLIAAAGNTDFPNCPNPVGMGVTFPARYPEVMAVSGTLYNDNFAEPGNNECPNGSRYGPEVELSAPFWAQSMSRNGGWGTSCGTSFSAPVVSGVAALLWTQNPSWTASMVRNRLRSTARDLPPTGFDNKFGYGRVSAFDALYLPPPPVFGVTISGPDQVLPYAACLFSANPANGVEPYSYAWTADGTPVGSDSPFYRHPAGTNGFELGITVTDGEGRVANNIFSVSVSYSAPECLDQ